MSDPDLPIPLGPCSNGEYDPVPPSTIAREARRRALEACADTASRLGVSRRTFLRSLCAASTVLLPLDACTREAHRAAPEVPTWEPCGGFEIPPQATTEPEAAEGAVGGEEFIMDVQGHLLEYDLNPVFHGEGFYAAFAQQHCGEDDPRVCYSIEHFLESIFIRSDTNVVVLSALPIYPEGSPLSPEIMAETRRIVEGLCCDERILLHGQVLPNVGSLGLGAARDGGHRQPLPDPGLEDVHALPRLLRAGRRRLVARRPRAGAAAGRRAEFQERYGYPALTDERKAKVLGRNAARLYGIEPVSPRCDFTRGQLAKIREELRDGDRVLGPTSFAASADVREHHRMEVSSAS